MNKEENKYSNEQGSGRINPEAEKISFPEDSTPKDISEIDRQEGDMDHGELGGNFKKKHENMKKNISHHNEDLKEQDSPLKNTDNAFVKVNRDGSPLMPVEKAGERHDESKKSSTDQKKEDKP